MDNNQAESAQVRANKAKKLLLTIVIAVAAALVLLLAAIFILKIVERNLKDDEDEYHGSHHTIIYYDPIENIFEDEDYLDLNRNVYYTDTKTGEKFIINKDTVKEYKDTGIPLLYDMIQAVICGDADTYDAMFSDYYFSLDSKRKPKEHFYMQELYQINIAENSEFCGKQTDEYGNIYNQYVYTVTFMIHKNNGTFMLVDSDAEKPQVYYITDMSGEFKIDNIQTVAYKY